MPLANVPLINAQFGLSRHVFAAVRKLSAVEINLDAWSGRQVAYWRDSTVDALRPCVAKILKLGLTFAAERFPAASEKLESQPLRGGDFVPAPPLNNRWRCWCIWRASVVINVNHL